MRYRDKIPAKSEMKANKLELELCQAQAWLIVGLRFTLFLLEIQNKKQDEV